MSFAISIAQLNFVVGDLPGNARKIIRAAQDAHAAGARLLLTPELALCGYAAEDLYLRPAFLAACEQALAEVVAATAALPGLAVVVGHPQRLPHGIGEGGRNLCHNAASVLRDGVIEATYCKQELPNEGVFDERRTFLPGHTPCVFSVAGVRVGLLVCEDAWHPGPAQQTVQAGAQVLAVLNASPWHSGKEHERAGQHGGKIQPRHRLHRDGERHLYYAD